MRIAFFKKWDYTLNAYLRWKTLSHATVPSQSCIVQLFLRHDDTTDNGYEYDLSTLALDKESNAEIYFYVPPLTLHIHVSFPCIW
jgi:hypothetical protein